MVENMIEKITAAKRMAEKGINEQWLIKKDMGGSWDYYDASAISLYSVQSF